MTTRNWITYAEAAELIGEPEKFIRQLIESLAVRGCQTETEFLVDKDHLLGWNKRRNEPQFQVTKIYQGIQRVMLEHYRTIYAKEQAPHSGIRGALYEELVRDFLRDYLPQRFYIGSGQVLSSNYARDAEDLLCKISRQIDVVIFDAFNHPVLLPRYEIFPIEGTLAVIEVKSKLEKRTLIGTPKKPGALPNIESAKRLISAESQIPRLEPGEKIQASRHTSPLGVVFAFESIEPKTLAEHWKDWNACRGPHYRTDVIYLLEKKVLMVDTKRIERLSDPYQIWTCDPIGSQDKGRLVALGTPDVLLFFLSLLLRELRKMIDFSQHLVKTTPIGYLEETEVPRVLFSINNE